MSQAQKTPFSTSIGNFVSGQIQDALFGQGQVLPATVIEVGIDGVGNSIVTVNFDVFTEFTLPPVVCPIIGSEYVRVPIQIGDSGICISASVLLGGISGLAEGVLPSLINSGNLSSLVFVPISNALWTPPVDPTSLLLQGLGGVVIQDMEGQTTLKLTPEGVVLNAQTAIVFEVGGNSVTINESGIDIVGALTINGKPFLAHEHTGVQTGTGVTGGVVP